jgi:hypothetical protein
MRAHVKIEVCQATYYDAQQRGSNYWYHLALLLWAPGGALYKGTYFFLRDLLGFTSSSSSIESPSS